MNINILSVDISDIDNVQKGDEVLIIGEQNGEEITFNSFGGMINTLNYEVLVRIPDDLPRIVLE